jgi:hypothetical protein
VIGGVVRSIQIPPGQFPIQSASFHVHLLLSPPWFIHPGRYMRFCGATRMIKPGKGEYKDTFNSPITKDPFDIWAYFVSFLFHCHSFSFQATKVVPRNAVKYSILAIRLFLWALHCHRRSLHRHQNHYRLC